MGYSEKDKDKVFELLEKNDSIASISRETGVSEGTIRKWKKDAEIKKVDLDNLVVGQQELAGFLGMSSRNVGHLADKGMPKIKTGKYDLKECVLWYIKFLSGETKGGLGAEEKLKMLKLKVRREEISLRKEEGDLIELSEFEEETIADFNILVSNLSNLPGRIAPLVVGLGAGAIKKQIHIEIINALKKYSRDLDRILQTDDSKHAIKEIFENSKKESGDS